MTDFDENIGIEHDTATGFYSVRAVIVVHKVLTYARALCLPVKPYALDTIVYMVSSDSHINRCMKLDACGLRTAEL